MIIRHLLYLLIGSLLVLFLVSCGGSSDGADDTGGNSPGSSSGDGGGATGGSGDSTQNLLSGSLVLSYQGKNSPVTQIRYRVSSSNNYKNTGNSGGFSYQQGQQLIFTLAGRDYRVPAKKTVSILDLARGNVELANHLALMLVNFDSDGNPGNGIYLSNSASKVNPYAIESVFMKQLYKTLGRMPKALFEPSLGINTEAVQGVVDTVGQSMPFVDIFRTARPFKELSKTTYDANGWPTSGNARTKLLQGLQQGAIPDGKYTLLYEGRGHVGFGRSRLISSVAPLPAALRTNGYKGNIITVNVKPSDNAETNVIHLSISGIDETDPVRNIRIIMPGGTCKDSSGRFNPFIRVESQQECSANTTFVSFVDRLKKNRNAIIFNPDYLMLLRNFKVVRMMNLMEASPGRVFCTVTKDGISQIDNDCVVKKTLWKDRATMDDAVWGGSSRTNYRLHKGVPVEVLVALANQTGADPWFNIHHSADAHYVSKFAESVFNTLDSHRKVYIEYSNEVWNSGFLGFHYMSIRGKEVKDGNGSKEDKDEINQCIQRFSNYNGGSRDENYFTRSCFYSMRAIKFFNIWSNQFGGNERLIRVLGTSQGDTILSRVVLEEAKGKVDALAMAPYFFGCTDRRGSCDSAPKILSEAQSVDDLFDIIDQPAVSDPSALASTLNKIKRQANIANDYGVDLVAYEGGQHLTIMGSMGKLPAAEKKRLRGLFRAANRDSRMKQRYTRLLYGWKAQQHLRASLFTLYTLPQSFYEFGNWGIKEHLNKSRSLSPKFDAAMRFQEQVGRCWWVGCR